MTTTVTINNDTFELIWNTPWVGYIGTILLGYFIFRHMLFVIMIVDVTIAWLSQYGWFPKKGKRLKTTVHWAAALGLFVGFLWLGALMNWYRLIPQ